MSVYERWLVYSINYLIGMQRQSFAQLANYGQYFILMHLCCGLVCALDKELCVCVFVCTVYGGSPESIWNGLDGMLGQTPWSVTLTSYTCPQVRCVTLHWVLVVLQLSKPPDWSTREAVYDVTSALGVHDTRA